jgi:hypothetical protein
MEGRVKESTGSEMGVARMGTGDGKGGGPSGSGERLGVEGAKGQGGGGKDVVNEDRSSAEEASQSKAS